MNTRINTELTSLTEEEVLCVGGGVRTPGSLPTAIDKHGHTISMEEYMDRQLLAAKSGDANWVFDFEWTGQSPWDELGR